ncbi:MAG: signal recognition particle protein [Desulfovermiculus sp.]
MFESLSERLDQVFKKIKGHGHLDEKTIQEGLREVRLALLEADVNYKVVRDFVDRIRERSLGQEVLSSLTPGQQVIKIVHEELIGILGGESVDLNLHGDTGPAVLMLAGLQGSGKTTTAAKLALHLKNQGHSPFMVPADVYRPAAIDQLHTLAQEIQVPAYASRSDMDPVGICQRAIDQARQQGCDVVLLDTAGRLHIDEQLMEELSKIKDSCRPQEILFVADAMTGQDAVTVAERFNQLLDISGVVLTKLEGDARGGAALSIRSITDKPVKFVGIGEKLKDLEVFHPDRVASRILGMGDMLTLIEKAQQEFDDQESAALEAKFQKAEFDLEDFRSQMRKVRKLGSMESLLKMIPGMGKIKDQLKDARMPEHELNRVEAIINSMTPQERHKPKILNPSRKERIALGSGTTQADVNQLLKNFSQMQKMLKKVSKQGGGMQGLDSLDPSAAMGGGFGQASAGSRPKKKVDRKKQKLKAKQKKKKKK